MGGKGVTKVTLQWYSVEWVSSWGRSKTQGLGWNSAIFGKGGNSERAFFMNGLAWYKEKPLENYCSQLLNIELDGLYGGGKHTEATKSLAEVDEQPTKIEKDFVEFRKAAPKGKYALYSVKERPKPEEMNTVQWKTIWDGGHNMQRKEMPFFF